MGAPLWDNWAPAVSEQPAPDAAADAPPDAAPQDAPQDAQGDAQQDAAQDTQQSDVPSEVDQAHTKECTQALQAEWGDAFEPTMQGVKTLVAQAPDYIRDFILGGRFEDGRAIGNDPGVIKWLASLVPSGAARQANPPGDGARSLDAEIAKIEAKIGTKAYIRDEAMQARYRLLLTQRAR